MERQNPFIRIVLAVALCMLLLQAFSQDQTIGINTDAPNGNAVLHLHAPNGDQGLLVPTLSASQRGAMALAAADNGLLVFDTDENLFYYWHAPSWIALSVSDDQQLTLDGNILRIDNGNEVDLGVIVPSIDMVATEIAYDSDSSLLTAQNVQDAIDELDDRVGKGEAVDIAYSGVESGLGSADVQSAIDEMYGMIYDETSLVDIPGGNLDFNSENASFAASNVQEAIEILDDAVLELKSNDLFTVDADSNHLMGYVADLPIGMNNIVIANGTDLRTEPGSMNIIMGYGARTNTNNVAGLAIGPGTFVSGNRGIAMGVGASVTGGVENAMAFGTETVAALSNTIVFGDGINSPLYRFGVNTQLPLATFQVGENLGFFHYNGSNDQGPIVGEIIGNNVYASESKLISRTGGVSSGIVFLEEDGVKMFAVDATSNDHQVLDLNNDVVPTLFAGRDTVRAFGSMRIANTVQIGSHDTSSGTAVGGGTMQYHQGNNEFLVHNGTEWLRVVTESASGLATAPTVTLVPGSGVLAGLPDTPFFPLESGLSTSSLRSLEAGDPGQQVVLTNSGTVANGTDSFLIEIIDWDSIGGHNLDIQGSGDPNSVILPAGSSITFIYDNVLGRWVEVSRSINK